MTPKEKAAYLVQRFTDEIGLPPPAKDCAIECVDQILTNFEGLHKPEYCKFDAILAKRQFTYTGEYEYCMTGYDMVAYWEEVKIEIEKV